MKSTRTSIERMAVAGVAATSLATIVAHGLALVATSVVSPLPGASGVQLTIATIAAVICCAGSWMICRGWPTALAASALVASGAAWVLATLQGGLGPASLALLVTTPVASLCGRMFASRLPDWIDGALRRRPVVSVLWGLLGVATAIQTARLTTHMADPAYDYVPTTTHPFWAQHECAVAYVYAAELLRRGESNVYHVDHYPATNRSADPHTEIAGLTPDDPYQYPPQFLLLPRLAIALTSSYDAIRVAWYVLQTLAFVAVAIGLARWVGGKQGQVAALLLPIACISVPALYNFQYGQFHLAAIALAIGGMVAFDSRRNALGGALLAAAISAKLFPALLLVPLLVQRKWRALGWTAGFGVAIAVVTWGVLGAAPFLAFFEYQLPRLQNGDAFAFEKAWPEMTAILLSINLSPAAFVRKLNLLGVPGMIDALAQTAQFAFSICVLGAAVLMPRRQKDRGMQLVCWLALVNLAAAASPGAWADYLPASSVWMMTLLLPRLWRLRPAGVIAALCTAWLVILPGAVPYGEATAGPVVLALSSVGSFVLIGTNAWVLLHARRELQARQATISNEHSVSAMSLAV